MSLDCVDEQSEILPALLLEISVGKCQPPSPTASSEPPSPNPLSDSILLQHEPISQSHTPASSTSTHTTASSSSLPAPPLSVKFAPLPELAPRKRRSTTPLGMAARGALARRRRGNQAEAQPDVPPANITYLTPEEFEIHRIEHEALAARYAQHQGSAAALAAREYEAEQEGEEEEEKAKAGDADTVSLGKIVKVARKGFWWRVVSKDGESGGISSGKAKDTDKAKGAVKVKEESLRRRKSDSSRGSASSPSPTMGPIPSLPTLPLRPILAPITANVEDYLEMKEEDGLWGEEIGDGIPLNVSQTETFVEGRPIFPSMKTTSSKVEALAKPEDKPIPVLQSSNSRSSLMKSKAMVNVKS